MLLPHFPFLTCPRLSLFLGDTLGKMGEAACTPQGRERAEQNKCEKPNDPHRISSTAPQNCAKNPPLLRSNCGHICAPCGKMEFISAANLSRVLSGHAIGTYIADFCAPRQKLIIEVDGSQHLDQEEYDSERTAFLEAKGYKVLRFWNSDVLNKITDVMGVVLEELEKPGSGKGNRDDDR